TARAIHQPSPQRTHRRAEHQCHGDADQALDPDRQQRKRRHDDRQSSDTRGLSPCWRIEPPRSRRSHQNRKQREERPPVNAVSLEQNTRAKQRRQREHPNEASRTAIHSTTPLNVFKTSMGAPCGCVKIFFERVQQKTARILNSDLCSAASTSQEPQAPGPPPS